MVVSIRLSSPKRPTLLSAAFSAMLVTTIGKAQEDITSKGGPLPATRSIRIFGLVHLLTGRRGRRVSEIARRFGASERSVFRDLVSGAKRMANGDTLKGPTGRNRHRRETSGSC
jgi:hypothetical protein